MATRRKSAPAPPPRRYSLSRPQLFLALVASDRTYQRSVLGVAAGQRPVWLGKCIHCQSALWVGENGQPGPGVTLEHIVPSSLGGSDANDNLALACARCNQQKGTRLDVLGLANPRLQAVIATLQARRKSRWRPPPPEVALSEAAQAWLKVPPPEWGQAPC